MLLAVLPRFERYSPNFLNLDLAHYTSSIRALLTAVPHFERYKTAPCPSGYPSADCTCHGSQCPDRQQPGLTSVAILNETEQRPVRSSKIECSTYCQQKMANVSGAKEDMVYNTSAARTPAPGGKRALRSTVTDPLSLRKESCRDLEWTSLQL
nr:hypothetical protein CFP56_21241 [Quercus suber]